VVGWLNQANAMQRSSISRSKNLVSTLLVMSDVVVVVALVRGDAEGLELRRQSRTGRRANGRTFTA
jgi:hypothetical protein